MIYFLMVLVWFLFQVMHGSNSFTSADLSQVVDLSTLHALFTTGQASSGLMVLTISHIVSVPPLLFFILLKSFDICSNIHMLRHIIMCNVQAYID